MGRKNESLREGRLAGIWDRNGNMVKPHGTLVPVG